jgi:oligopeptide transport system permease protein
MVAAQLNWSAPSWMSGRGFGLALYILRRLLWMIPVLFFVSFITFTLMHFAPGSPWDTSGRQLSPAVEAALNAKYGLDQPLWKQFLLYLWNVLHFDFGTSYQYIGQSVGRILVSGWPYTLTIGAISFLLVVIFGIGLGVIAALRQNTWIDYLTLGISTLGASVPNFVVGMVLIIVLAIGLNRLTGATFYLPTGGFGIDQHLILPVLTLSFLPTAFLARLTRSSTLETLRQDYVRTAWAKGLQGRLVVLRHILRNALIPVVTALGPTFANLVTGSFVVETLFSIPGIGRNYVAAIEARDYPMILGTTLLYAFMIVFANLLVDVAYHFIDPRVRLG